MWVALDDTDDRQGGCTTHVAHHLIETLTTDGLHVNAPRLVRLWPMAPHRTRGNAAVCFEVEGQSMSEELLNRLWAQVEDLAQAGSSPALIVARRQPPQDLYVRGVRGRIEEVEVDAWLRDEAQVRTKRGGRGRIGATIALAWRGARTTWETIAWRSPERVGTKRDVDREGVRAWADHPDLIGMWDASRQRSLIQPHTPCPVLIGVRGWKPQATEQATTDIASRPGTESPSGQRTFQSNQGSGDHLDSTFAGRLTASPHRMGRSVRLETDAGTMVAWEKSGPVRGLALRLIQGDRIEAEGLQDERGWIHLERLRFVDRTQLDKPVRPKCQCGRRYESSGRSQDLRCRTCGTKVPPFWVDGRTPPSDTWVEPPERARRHLAPWHQPMTEPPHSKMTKMSSTLPRP